MHHQPRLVVTVTASNITGTDATVSGSLTCKGTAAGVTVSFEYGTSTKIIQNTKSLKQPDAN